MLERNGVEILERDNRTAKRIKGDLIYFGGSSNPERSTITPSEFRELTDSEGRRTGELELIEASERRRNCGQGAQLARLMLGRKLLLTERQQLRPDASSSHLQLVSYQKEQKSTARDDVREHLNVLHGISPVEE
eukprot:6194388-Pleurochrysis_carterae.AAC.1